MAASILFVLPHAAFGGAERLTAEIIAHLKAAGHRPLVAILTQKPGLPDSAPLWFAPLAPVHRARGPAELLRLIAAEDVGSMVICGLSPAYAMLPRIAGARPALRIVAFQFNARECLREHHLYASYLDAIIAESLDVAAALGTLRRPPVTVISSGVDVEAIAARPRREHLGSRLAVACIGRFDAAKNPAAFIRLARRLVGHDLDFVMAGAGPRPWRMPRHIDDRGLLDDAALADLLDGIDILVVPSRNDGRPLIIQEAQARAIAVIASRVGGIPELIEHERTGLLVPPDDDEALAAAVLRLAADAPFRQRIGAAGLSRVRRDGDLAAILPRYEAVITGGARTPPGRP